MARTGSWAVGTVMFVMAALATQAVAEVPITINAGIGRWYFDNDRSLDDANTPWASIEYAFNDQWAAELFYADDDSDYENGISADVTTWQLDVLYYGGSYIGEENRLRPYVALGAGEIDIDAGAFDTVETTVNLGLGLRWMWTKRLGMRFEARMFRSLDEERTDMLLSAGLNYYFGKVDADVVAVAAPLDTDGDGVYDNDDQCPNTPADTRVDSKGCPLQVAQIESIRLTIEFPFDSSTVQEQYFSDVGELAGFLKRFEEVHIDIEGHTDSAGPQTYNQQLSQRRAQAVVDLLVNEYGISMSRLQAIGHGESQPIASNDTEEGRRENRRVMAAMEVEYTE